jgi:hypothetical protein
MALPVRESFDLAAVLAIQYLTIPMNNSLYLTIRILLFVVRLQPLRSTLHPFCSYPSTNPRLRRAVTLRYLRPLRTLHQHHSLRLQHTDVSSTTPAIALANVVRHILETRCLVRVTAAVLTTTSLGQPRAGMAFTLHSRSKLAFSARLN